MQRLNFYAGTGGGALYKTWSNCLGKLLSEVIDVRQKATELKTQAEGLVRKVEIDCGV